MTRFPTLPPNSCLGGPPPPQNEPFVGTVGHICRMEGYHPLLAVAQVCTVEAGAQIIQQQHARFPDRMPMINWLLAHAAAWTDLEQQRAAMPARQAAE